MKYKTYNKNDLLEILPFGKTKLNELLQAEVLPVIKIGRDYITNEKLLDDWFQKYKFKEIRF